MRKRIGFGHSLQDLTASTAGATPTSVSMTSISAGLTDAQPDRGNGADFGRA